MSVSLNQLLDEELYRRGMGSMQELADELAGDGNLNGRQIYASLRDWRGGARAGESFDLALRVVVAVPGLLEELARRAGFLLVRRPDADPRAAAARAAAASGMALSVFLDAAADGRFDAAERHSIELAVERAERALEALRAFAVVSGDEERVATRAAKKAGKGGA